MAFEEFLSSPIGFLCCVFLVLFCVIYLIDLWRRLAEAQKEYDKSSKKCHCCGQRLSADKYLK